MANSLYDKGTLRTFKNAALDLIDNAYDSIIASPSDEVKYYLDGMPPMYHAREFRTVRVGGARGMGHTLLINRLAYDVDSSVGAKYSTLILSPTGHMTREMYAPYRHHEWAKQYPRMAEYSFEFHKRVKQYTYGYDSGKTLTTQYINSLSFKFGEYMEGQRRAMNFFTGDWQPHQKFNLMLVDVVNKIDNDTMDTVYGMFADKVELFVLFQ